MLKCFILVTVCEGARTDVIAELVSRGSDLEVIDKAGLPLAAVARLLTNRQSVLLFLYVIVPRIKLFQKP